WVMATGFHLREDCAKPYGAARSAGEPHLIRRPLSQPPRSPAGVHRLTLGPPAAAHVEQDNDKTRAGTAHNLAPPRRHTTSHGPRTSRGDENSPQDNVPQMPATP